MAWSTIKCTFPRIQSYVDAAQVWSKAVIFRSRSGYAPITRGLVDRRKKHLTIEQTANQDFVLCLYNHPVVTWHHDNSVTICALRSTRSTSKFASHCMPAGMYVSLYDNHLTVQVDRRLYKVTDKITFRQRDNTWKADEITSPWIKQVVNRERAKQVLDEIGYAEFRTWLKVYVQMSESPHAGLRWADNVTIIHMLRERKWRELLEHHFHRAWSNPEHTLRQIRQVIYTECKCMDKKSVPFIG